MNLSDLANLSQIIAAVGVVISIGYLAVQIRGNTKVVSAQARYGLSEFALRFSIFRAEHADRFAKLQSGVELTDGDRVFQYWSHVQLLLHAETYFYHHQLGLMPEGHWHGYGRFMTKYIQSADFREAWDDIAPGFRKTLRDSSMGCLRTFHRNLVKPMTRGRPKSSQRSSSNRSSSPLLLDRGEE